MQNNSEAGSKTLGATITDQLFEQVVYHNATICADLHRYHTITGEQEDAFEERARLIEHLTMTLSGACSVDEITDFAALKLPELDSTVKEKLAQEDALEAERRLARDSWRMSPRHVWESVFLFGERFEPLSYRSTPTVELPAREWFDSLHLLPDQGIELSDGNRLTLRLSWSTYSGAIETDDFCTLKAEASALASSKLWHEEDWKKQQLLAPPDFDDEAYVVPEVIARQYAVDPVTGTPLFAYATVAPASYKSDSGDTQYWRTPADASSVFITHWFKGRSQAETCRAISQGIVCSTRAARLRSSQKKQSADSHKLVATNLQARLRLLAASMPLDCARREKVNLTISELDPMLERSKSAPVMKWTGDAIPLLNRLVREVTNSDETTTATIDGLFAFVLENVVDGDKQNAAVNAIDELDALQRKGKLRTLEDRAEKIEAVLLSVLHSMNAGYVEQLVPEVKAA